MAISNRFGIAGIQIPSAPEIRVLQSWETAARSNSIVIGAVFQPRCVTVPEAARRTAPSSLWFWHRLLGRGYRRRLLGRLRLQRRFRGRDRDAVEAPSAIDHLEEEIEIDLQRPGWKQSGEP